LAKTKKDVEFFILREGFKTNKYRQRKNNSAYFQLHVIVFQM